MVRHNNCIPNGHFHKDWQRFVRLHFGQPFKKIRRHAKRVQKLLARAPRPVENLRPLVHCPTLRYNSKLRVGRGFSLAELKAAKLNPKYAKTIGISVDHRRRNKSYNSLLKNAQVLRVYLSKLFLFPKGKQKQAAAGPVQYTRKNLNNVEPPKKAEKARTPTEDEKKFQAFITLRVKRSEQGRLSRKLKRQKSKLDQMDERK